MNIVAPSSSDVRAMNYVLPIVPRVTGQVTEVPIEPNRPIKKGDVLFKIDPVPFEQAVKAAEAKLAELKVGLITAEAYQRGLDDELWNMTADHRGARGTPRPREETRSAIHRAGRERCRASRGAGAGGVRRGQSHEPDRRGESERIEDQAEDRRAHRGGRDRRGGEGQGTDRQGGGGSRGREIRSRRHDAPGAGQRAGGQPRAAARRARDAVADACR